MTDEDGTILERYRYRVYGEHEILTSNFDTKNNNCYVSCDNTYQSCFENCNEDPTCEAGCLSDQSDCYDVCDSNPDNVIYAGNVHNFLWGGSLYEPETDLYWMRNRYYHKDMHRFINQDPIGIWGDANNLGNGFAYVAGMVIEASDPTGLDINNETNVGSWVSSSGMDSIAMLMNHAKAPGAVGIAAQAIGIGVSSAVELNSSGVSLKSTTGVAVGVALGIVMGSASIPVGLAALLFEAYIKNYPTADDSRIAAVLGVSGSKYNETRQSAVNKARKLVNDKTPSIGSDRKSDFFTSQTTTTATDAYDKDTGKLIGEVFTAKNSEGKVASYIVVGDGKGGLVFYEIKSDENGEYFEDRNGNKIYIKRGKNNNKNYPLDPDDATDRVQSMLLGNVLKKMLKMGDENPLRDQMIIQVEGEYGDGRRMFVRNPFYRSKDPIKRVHVIGTNGAGKPIFGINPFAPKDGSYFRSKFEEGLYEHGLFTPEIDFWE